MSVEPRPVVAIGGPLPYADGAEARLLDVISRAENRRVGSEELAAAICDWPTAYHLAPERATLLVPLSIGPGDRVLDIGAGSGVNTRICADRGAQVTAVEGSADRAELIAHRCAGLDQVEVLCGPLAALGEDRKGSYDCVLVIGVLEYAGSGPGGGGGAEALLKQAVEALASGGVVVLAIENQLGLKYLLGYPEDHLGLPWVGWEGYPDDGPVTWSRRKLAQMLADAGLVAQRWLYPFPDYKLPTTVLDESLYQRADAVDMVDQLVRHPTSGAYSRPVLVADDRAAHRTAVEAGLGPELANSFLVVAGCTPGALDGRIDKGVLAWRVTSDRSARWTQRSTVAVAGSSGDGSGLVIKRRLDEADATGAAGGWLGQVEVAEEPYHLGRNLEQDLLDAAREGRVVQVGELLRMWRAVLAEHETPIEQVTDPHPYLPSDTTRVLPSEWLDAGLDNFVVTPEGLRFVDREWVAVGGVDVRLAVVRGLWKAVAAMLSANCHLPWPPTWSNDRLVIHLGSLIEADINEELLSRWRKAEAELIALVYRQPEDRLAELGDAAGRSRMNQLLSPMASYRRMEHEVHMLRALVAELSEPHEMAAAHERDRNRLKQATAELEQAVGKQADSEAELAEARARLARVAWRERAHNTVARLLRRGRR